MTAPPSSYANLLWFLGKLEEGEEFLARASIVLLPLCALIAVIIIVCWLIVVGVTRNIHVALKSGTKTQDTCGYKYLEKETGRAALYKLNKSVDLKKDLSNALTGVIACLFILFFFIFLIVLLSGVKWAREAGVWLGGEVAPGGPNKIQYLVLLGCTTLVVFMIATRLGVQAMATVLVVHPLYTADGPLAKYGMSLKDAGNQNSIYALTIFVIVFGLGYIMFNHSPYSATILLVILLVIMTTLSLIYSYLKNLQEVIDKYDGKRGTLLSKVNSQGEDLTNGLWDHLKANIKRAGDSNEEEPRLQDFKAETPDKGFNATVDYLMHAKGNEDVVLGTGKGSIKDMMRDLRDVEGELDQFTSSYTNGVFYMSLVFAVLVGYPILHLIFKMVPNATMFIFVFLFIAIFATVMYTWMSGEVYG
jgi:hypothetical protein